MPSPPLRSYAAAYRFGAVQLPSLGPPPAPPMSGTTPHPGTPPGSNRCRDAPHRSTCARVPASFSGREIAMSRPHPRIPAQAAKRRIDQLLVEQGLAESRARAQALVLAGVVSSGGRRSDKPGEQLAADAALAVKGN